MLAAVFEGEGKLALKEVAVPGIEKADEVLLEVEAASICGTDCQILKVPAGHPATPGAVLGHEYVAKVLEPGSGVSHLKPGDRVAIDPNLTCGLCRYCRIGLPNMCENMTTLGIFINGGFAKYNVAPARALHPISADLPTDVAIFAEPMSCVVNGSNKLALRPGESVLVLGAGPIGLYYTALMKANGASKIIVAEVTEMRAAKAKEMGADIVINPIKESLPDLIKQETQVGVDAAIDAVGSLMADALLNTRRGGRILLFGMNSNAHYDLQQYDITRYEKTVIGTFIANHTFPATIQLLESGQLPLEKLITHRMGLEAIAEGMDIMRSGDAIEIIVTP
jgi:2-desacetyl-2-hydroxyethyl bacteriochlorophyllide A dehydrogenase